MKYLVTVLSFAVIFIVGCNPEILRPAGNPYPGYSCRESIMHYYSYCSEEKISKEKFESKVKKCEEVLASKICDKEYASLLWCMGRVDPASSGTYTRGGGVGAVSGGVAISGPQKTSTMDGCSCAGFEGALKKCYRGKEMWDTYDESSPMPTEKTE